MRVERVRLARDASEGERDADRRTRGGPALVDLRRPRGAAELPFQIRAPIDAFRRQVGVELERMPPDHRAHGGIARRDAFQRGFEPPLADVAPGTYDVGNDVDRELSRRRFGHGVQRQRERGGPIIADPRSRRAIMGDRTRTP